MAEQLRERHKTNHYICIHSALLYAGLIGLGVFVVAGWLPLIPPHWDAAQVTQMFIEDRFRVRVGTAILMFASPFLWVFSGAISAQMKRIEGHLHPLANIQMAASTGTVIIVMFAGLFWLCAGFRPDMPPQNVQLFNDMAWFFFVAAYPPIFVQVLAIGICILNNESGLEVYPRWLGFANLWAAFIVLPGALVPFFHRGPFAWDGIIAFWLVAVIFFGWILTMWWQTFQSIKRMP